MYKKIDEVDFIVFDVETTGLDPKAGDRIVEIAALHCRAGESLGSFSSLINPQRDISPEAFAVNRISREMVQDAPVSSLILPKFLEFSQGACLVGYNVGFDIGFLNNELKLADNRLGDKAEAIDVLRMARNLLPGIAGYSLANVSRYLGISATQKHRASSDVEVTFNVFRSLLSALKEKGLDNYYNLYNLFGFNTKVTEDINNQHLSAIQKAIDLGVGLKIRYYSGSTAEISERHVQPIEIVQQGKSRYMVGYCHLRKDKRTFRINAILELNIVEGCAFMHTPHCEEP